MLLPCACVQLAGAAKARRRSAKVRRAVRYAFGGSHSAASWYSMSLRGSSSVSLVGRPVRVAAEVGISLAGCLALWRRAMSSPWFDQAMFI